MVVVVVVVVGSPYCASHDGHDQTVSRCGKCSSVYDVVDRHVPLEVLVISGLFIVKVSVQVSVSEDRTYVRGAREASSDPNSV